MDASKGKTKQVPCCGCQLPRDKCETCHEGYLERTLQGLIPHFRTVEVATKQVPVCSCQKELAECSDCGQGFMQRTMQGEVPFFKTVEIEGTDSANDTTGGGGRGLQKSVQIRFGIHLLSATLVVVVE